jgi:hypothetical protein
MDEIQKYQHEKNYKALFNSDIAAYNLKQQTQKNLNNELASSGMQTQGYGTSAHVGVENNTANLYSQNQQAYNEAENTAAEEAQTRADTNAEKAETAATESDNQLATFLSYSDGSDDQISSYMKNYGYTLQSDGTWKDKDGNQPSNYILSTIESVKNGTATTNTDIEVDSTKKSTYDSTLTGAEGGVSFVNANKSTYSGINTAGYSSNDIASATVGNKDNTSTDTLKNIVGDEVQAMVNYVKDGKATDGTLFRLQRGSGKGETYLVMYVNGKFYLCSDDDREQDGSQVSNRYNQYTGTKVYFRGGKQV